MDAGRCVIYCISCIKPVSLNEVEYFIHLSHRLGYLDDAERERLVALQSEAACALQGLIRYWER